MENSAEKSTCEYSLAIFVARNRRVQLSKTLSHETAFYRADPRRTGVHRFFESLEHSGVAITRK